MGQSLIDLRKAKAIYSKKNSGRRRGRKKNVSQLGNCNRLNKYP